MIHQAQEKLCFNLDENCCLGQKMLLVLEVDMQLNDEKLVHLNFCNQSKDRLFRKQRV